MIPIIQINNLNQMQGPTKEVERHFLFVGRGSTNAGKLLSVNTQSDFGELLGDESTPLKDNVIAAMLNAGQNWTGHVHVLDAEDDWRDAVKDAQRTATFEAVVVVDPLSSNSAINEAYTLRNEIIATWGRWQVMLVAVPGLNPESEDWPAYETKMAGLQDDIAAPGVMLVPQLHGNNIGALAGRLCNHAVTVADTPMRVKTGPVVGLGEEPLDSNSAPLTLATLQSLEKKRYSVPYWFPDYDGVYWADGNMLEAEGGDYQVIENQRVADKIARKLRVRAISRIGDRQLNSTPASMAAAKLFFMRDLRAMSKSVTIAGQTFPGEILPPEDEDIVIEWLSQYEVVIYALAQPHNCPKKITINIMLDLTPGGAA